MLPRLWVIRYPAQTGHRVADQASSPPIPFNRDYSGRQVSELTISFTSPNAHPKTATLRDPSQVTVATTHTVTGTHSKRYKPRKRLQRAPTLALL
jgi:hypothetical protein